MIGCWFHYSQNIFKNMAKVGLLEAYKKNPAFKIWLELVMGIPLLPSGDIVEVWTELKNQTLPDTPVSLFKKFKRYIEKT